jgi:hypothetical protein
VQASVLSGENAMQCTYYVICRGPFRGRPYDGPLCDAAGVPPGHIYHGCEDDAAWDDCAKLDALGAADFHVYVWTDESGAMAHGDRIDRRDVRRRRPKAGRRGRPHDHSTRVSVGGRSRQRPAPGTLLAVERDGVRLVPERRAAARES